MTAYSDFLATKHLTSATVGRDLNGSKPHPSLFPFQAAIVRWAARKGRAAVFADTGLGKTFIQLEWARLLSERTLIVAPLSVARQTIREAAKINVPIVYSRDGKAADDITITNYEMVHRFDPAVFGAVVLDESSILKALDGKTRRTLTEMFAATPLRLCCTATPAPNDLAEIGNHAEFLGVMSHREMLSAFFVHGSDDSGKDGWRLKGHAEEAFFRWLASWGMAVRTPSDIGYSDDGYLLPPLAIRPAFVPTDYVPDGQLFFGVVSSLSEYQPRLAYSSPSAQLTGLTARFGRSTEWISETRDCIRLNRSASLARSISWPRLKATGRPHEPVRCSPATDNARPGIRGGLLLVRATTARNATCSE